MQVASKAMVSINKIHRGLIMKCIKSLSVLGVVLATSYAGLAQADLNLTPGTFSPWTTDQNTPLSESQLKTLVGYAGSLTQVYKADVGSESKPATVESGIAQSFYATTFANIPLDPAEATITWDGPSWIDCPACYLVVKDGNQTPAQYVFDIGTWNGQHTINLTDFWAGEDPAGKGAISHVEIWSSVGVVPEPQTYALMLAGLGLVGFAASRRKAA